MNKRGPKSRINEIIGHQFKAQNMRVHDTDKQLVNFRVPSS